MTWPITNYSRIWLRGRYIDLGKAATGSGYGITDKALIVKPSPAFLKNIEFQQHLRTSQFTATPDSLDGLVLLQVPATDDPDIDRPGFTYRVTDPIGQTFDIAVPINTPVVTDPTDPLHGEQVIELFNVSPAPGPSGGSVQMVPGPSGRGIASVDVEDSRLIVTFDDDTTYDAGEVAGGGGGTSTPDASTTVKGKAVILGGTADAPTVPYGSVTGAPTSLPPSGGAGGVLGGTYPNPSFSVDMVTQAEHDTDLAGKASATSLSAHIGSTSNPHAVTKAQLGLGSVNDTSDAGKPISAATQVALDGLPFRAANTDQTGAAVGRDYAFRLVSAGQYALRQISTMLDGVGDGTSDDTAAINAQLAAAPAGAALRGVPGKNYLISAPLVLRPGGQQSLDMTDCTVTMKAGTDNNFLRNAAVAAQRTVTDAATTAGSSTVTSTTAAFTGADVGRMIAVTGAGVIGAGPGREVFYGRITAVTDAQTVTVASSTSGITGASATVTGASARVHDRDSRIRIRGGRWIRGGNNGAGNNLHNLMLRRVDDLAIEGVTVTSSAGKYGISLGDVTNFTVRDPRFFTASDGVHLLGPASAGSVSGVRGTLGDDAFGLTACDYTTYTDTIGDVTGIEVTDIVASTPSTALLKFTSAPGVLVDKIHVRGATQLATAQPAFGFADDTGALNIGSVDMSDIVGRGYARAGTIKTLRVRNWQWDATGDANYGFYALSTTIDTLDIGGLAAASAYANTHFAQIQAAATVNHLTVHDARFTGGTGSYLVQFFDGTGTIGKLSLINVRRDPTSGGGLVHAITAGAQIGTLALFGCFVTAGSWFADLATTTTVYAFGCEGSGTARPFNVRATGVVTLHGATIRATAGGSAIAAGGVLLDNTGTGAASPLPAGQYFYPVSQEATATNGSLGNGVARVVPWLVAAPVSLARLAAEIVTAGETGSVLRLGVWADNGSRQPGSLVVDGGTIAADSTGVKEVTVAANLPAGVYWVGGAVQAAPTTQPVVRTIGASTPQVAVPVGSSLPGANALAAGVFATGMGGAFPGAFPTPGGGTSGAPRLIVRTA